MERSKIQTKPGIVYIGQMGYGNKSMIYVEKDGRGRLIDVEPHKSKEDLIKEFHETISTIERQLQVQDKLASTLFERPDSAQDALRNNPKGVYGYFSQSEPHILEIISESGLVKFDINKPDALQEIDKHLKSHGRNPM